MGGLTCPPYSMNLIQLITVCPEGAWKGWEIHNHLKSGGSSGSLRPEVERERERVAMEKMTRAEAFRVASARAIEKDREQVIIKVGDDFYVPTDDDLDFERVLDEGEVAGTATPTPLRFE